MSPRIRNGAPVIVDYAHTPDALETALAALRPHASGRLVVVFGCGGDRDPGKRPLMGAIAERLADRVIVTDDNPRSEEAAADPPRHPRRLSQGARRSATAPAPSAPRCSMLEPGDVLLIAGKGHERGQIVGDKVLPFDDAEVARAMPWPRRGDDARCGPPPRPQPRPAGAPAGDWSARGVSIDSRTVAPGDLFVALTGPNFDGHDFVADALAKGAAAALVAAARRQASRADAPLLVVADTQAALEALGRAARARASGHHRRRHRQRRQDRHQGGAAPRLRAPGPHRRLGRQPQQPVGRAAVAGAHAARDRLSASSRWA